MPARARHEPLPADRAARCADMLSSVCAVVITYQPGSEVIRNIQAIRAQAAHVIVVDNETTSGSRELLAPLTGDPAIELLFNRENTGIAAALNQGIGRALAGGFGWVATFDQDSRITDGFIAALLDAQATYPDREHLAIVAPLYRDRNLAFLYSPSRALRSDDTADACVAVTATSGNLVAARAFQMLGGFRDDFFIDCVDFEFCLRCRRHGWRVLETRRAVLEHAQGKWEQRRLLWRRPRVNDYGPVRRYYQARNRLVMYARLGWVDPAWTLRDAWGYACDFLKLLLFCEHRALKLQAIAVGGWHALTGRRGRWAPPARYTSNVPGQSGSG